MDNNIKFFPHLSLFPCQTVHSNRSNKIVCSHKHTQTWIHGWINKFTNIGEYISTYMQIL